MDKKQLQSEARETLDKADWKLRADDRRLFWNLHRRLEALEQASAAQQPITESPTAGEPWDAAESTAQETQPSSQSDQPITETGPADSGFRYAELTTGCACDCCAQMRALGAGLVILTRVSQPSSSSAVPSQSAGAQSQSACNPDAGVHYFPALWPSCVCGAISVMTVSEA